MGTIYHQPPLRVDTTRRSVAIGRDALSALNSEAVNASL